MRSHLGEEIRPIVTFAYITGWRIPSEILTLEWRQVDLRAGTVRLDPGATKNQEGRLFPLRYLGLQALLEGQSAQTEALQRERGILCPWVFHRNGRCIKDYRKAWEIACKAVGSPGRIPHDLRRTAVRNFERDGVSRSAAMKLTGHKTEAVYQRYAIVSEADLSEAVGKLKSRKNETVDTVVDAVAHKRVQ